MDEKVIICNCILELTFVVLPLLSFQDEFKRLYVQLEVLKQKNMKLGNPHLGQKLSAMTEAAGIREDTTCLDNSPANSPNMNGKRVVINLDHYSDATSL